jgi:hypothetical protein
MHRLTARFLLWFALSGAFAPLALALTAAPAHSCCLRKAHHCHSFTVAQSDPLNVHSPGCCSRESGRAVATSQWASPQPWAASAFADKAAGKVTESPAIPPATQLFTSQSTRAPPSISIA